MKFAFPQDPTHAISAMRRIDEAADTESGQSDLERQQDIAVVGQTVPLIFCDRHDWGADEYGTELGTNGGIWYSPRLIGLYPKALLANLLFLVGQGNIKNIKSENVYYGYTPLAQMTSEDYIVNDDGTIEVDADGNPLTQLVEPYFNYAYEAIPAGIDSAYQPGGSDELHIPNIRPREEFSLNGYSFTTNADCERLQILLAGDLYSQTSGTIVADPHLPQTKSKSKTCSQTKPGKLHTCNNSGPNITGYVKTGKSGERCSYKYSHISGGLAYYTVTCKETFYYEADSWYGDKGPRVEVEYYTYAVYRIRVFNDGANQETDAPVHDSTFTLRMDGRSPYAVPPIDLTPGTYDVVIELYEQGWFEDMVYNPILNTWTQYDEIAEYTQTRHAYTEAGLSPGKGVIDDGEIQITETIYTKIEYPEVPGGGEQTTGTFFDLTLAGIRGSIRALKPVDGTGPGYWIQTHMFIEQGVECQRLMPDYFDEAEEIGASHFLSDLIYYLLDKTQMIKEDQIDIESLKLACAVHNKYKLFYNGVLSTTTSFSEWLTRIAPYYLMTPRQVNGRYGLAPVVPVETDGTFSRASVNTYLKATFTVDDIIEGSYSRDYIPAKDRRDICFVMVYKDQPITSPGQTVTVEVRYSGTALKGPFEQHDLSEFVCTPNHAILAARYLLARRRYTTHTCSFNVDRQGAQLQPGDVVAVDLALQTTEGDGVTDMFYYQVERVSEEQSGLIALELIEFPVTTSDAGETISLIAQEIYEGMVSVQ